MAHNKTMKQIDGARLRKAILRRDLTVAKAGEALGRSRNFLGNAIRDGWIHQATMQLLDERFGINAAEYELRKEEPKEDTKTDDLAHLEEIIAKAVLRALEEFKEEHGPEAIVKAMEKWRNER